MEERIRSTDDKLQELGYNKFHDNKNTIEYVRSTLAGHHRVVILKSEEYGTRLFSYNSDLASKDVLPGSEIGLSYDELKLFIKKMEEIR